jgi:hypothetical protein
MRTNFLTALVLAAYMLPMAGCDRAAEETRLAKASNPELGERWQYPREREYNGRKVIVYAPQIRSWDEFKHFTAQVAVEFPDKDADARYAAIDLSGETALDRDARLVRIAQPKVDRVTFSGGKGSEEHENRIRKAVESEPLEMPLDVFLYYLADGVLESPPPAGFNDEAPPIHVVESPAFLLFVNGKPVPTAIADSGLELIGNANFPVLRDTKSDSYYLLTGDHRYMAAKLEGPWGTISELPAAFRKIPATGEFANLAAVVASAPKAGEAPAVITSFKPAEIIVLDGKPQGREIVGTGGLESIVNTESPLFRLDGTYYFLASGRWFSTKNLMRGPWKFTMPLPDAFARIPEHDEGAEVRASVPGTLEARRAVLEAQVPQTKTVKAGAAPDVTVAYAGGEPKFEPIAQTQVARAVNTANDIIQYGDKYYLCYEGMWYVADKPTGPWTATADVPAAIYQIPASSPSYPVTQVIVNTDDDGDVESSYNGAYAAGMFIGFGVAYYGTGWYYPPYYYGGYYYPYYGSYGHGSWYNPNTGGFGSRSVYYGPYGGYTYNQGYNPKTGRSSYLETAWDGNEWASSGGTYNPRTGISTETDRHYGEDSNKMKMDRTIQGPGGNEMDVKKRTDFDTGTRTTERKTDRGGSSEVTRQRQAGGGFTTDGTVKAADGRTATISGEHQGGQGTTTIRGSEGGTAQIDRERNQDGSVSREGSFSKDGQTIDTETRRDGRSSVTKAEGSGGGQAISVKDGPGDRTTIAQSGSGDIYAGHDGNVYRKTEDGWQQHGDGGWSDVDVPERPGDGTGSGLGEGERGGLGEGDRSGVGEGSMGAGENSFSRDQFDASSRDAVRDSAAGASGQLGGETGQRYGGSGALESRGTNELASQRYASGGGTSSRASQSNVQQLNRDAAARSGGYQNHQRRSASRSMSRGGGFRRR